MEFILLGALALVIVVGLLWLFITADVKLLAKILRYIGAGLLFAAAVWLALSDRVGIAMLLGSMAWGLFTGGHIWPGGWPHYNFPGGAKSGNAQSTRVATDWIEVELDHNTGAMSGRVLKGNHAGAALSALSKNDLLALYCEVSADEETARLLEAYFDRTFGADWRNAEQEQPRPRATSSTMSRAEAWKVLGLEEGASEEDIRATHKKLMMQNHPDRGGSDYLASKINEAKDVLLDD